MVDAPQNCCGSPSSSCPCSTVPLPAIVYATFSGTSLPCDGTFDASWPLALMHPCAWGAEYPFNTFNLDCTRIVRVVLHFQNITESSVEVVVMADVRRPEPYGGEGSLAYTWTKQCSMPFDCSAELDMGSNGHGSVVLN